MQMIVHDRDYSSPGGDCVLVAPERMKKSSRKKLPRVLATTMVRPMLPITRKSVMAICAHATSAENPDTDLSTARGMHGATAGYMHMLCHAVIRRCSDMDLKSAAGRERLQVHNLRAPGASKRG